MAIVRDWTTGVREHARNLASRFDRKAGWIPLLVLAVLAGFAYRSIFSYDPGSPAAPDLEDFFFTPSEKSPLLIYGLVPVLISMRWARLRAAFDPAGSAWVAAPLLAGGITIFLWGLYVDLTGFMLPSLMLTALGTAVLLGGTAFARVLVLPVAFLFLALPVPQVLVNQIIYPLQLWTVQYSSLLLDLLGIDHTIRGDFILVGSRIFQVIEGCSGFRSMETLVMAAIVYGEVFRLSGRGTMFLVLCAPPVAFVLNGFRVLAIMLLPESETVTNHTFQGLVAIVAGVLTLAAIESAMRPRLWRRAGADSRATQSTGPFRVAGFRAAVAGAILVGLSVASVWMPRWAGPEVRPQSLLTFSQSLGGWNASGTLKLDRAFLATVRFSEYINRRYVEGDQQVRVFVGSSDHLRRQLSILSEKTFLPGASWVVLDSESEPLEPGGPTVTTGMIGSGAERRLIYHWYQGTRSTAVELARALSAVDRSPARRPERAFVIRLSVDLSGAPSARDEALARLRNFAELVRSELAAIERRSVPAGS